MNQKVTNNILLNLSLLVAVILVSCNGNPTNENDNNLNSNPEETTASANVDRQLFYINSAENIALSEIIFEQNVLALHGENHELIGELKDIKRKYYDKNDQFKFSVKFKPDGSFKLRDENEYMKWKIKFDDDKIKIANNEEMLNAYKIQVYDNGKLKVKREDETLEEVRFSFSEATLNVKDRYVVRNFGASTALGILMIDEIPDIEKYIICAELLKAKR